ncbi:hypothetical protein ACCC88_13830 [Sphingomonas sp. Sphisp140]|uniref:hypothetical protein n=1 Tax=unclassified Sphingomonas TaxID=196159 RepID=UPI0039B08C62
MLVLAAALLLDPAPERCATVRGNYQIFADGDALRIQGSRHRLRVVVPALDKELTRRGWIETVAHGTFRICAANLRDPLKLTIRDRVRVTRYSGIGYRTRR